MTADGGEEFKFTPFEVAMKESIDWFLENYEWVRLLFRSEIISDCDRSFKLCSHRCRGQVGCIMALSDRRRFIFPAALLLGRSHPSSIIPESSSREYQLPVSALRMSEGPRASRTRASRRRGLAVPNAHSLLPSSPLRPHYHPPRSFTKLFSSSAWSVQQTSRRGRRLSSPVR